MTDAVVTYSPLNQSSSRKPGLSTAAGSVSLPLREILSKGENINGFDLNTWHNLTIQHGMSNMDCQTALSVRKPKSIECAFGTVLKDSENTESIECGLVVNVLVLMVVGWN